MTMEDSVRYSETTAIRFLDRVGRWQWVQLSLLLISYLAAGPQTFIIVFIGFQPKFACVDTDDIEVNISLLYQNSTDVSEFDNMCTAYDVKSNSSLPCTKGFRYSVQQTESIVSDWDLVCDKAYLSEVSQLLYIVGMAVGAAILAPMSDQFGRRRSLIALRSASLVCATAIIFSPGIVTFMIFRFLIGALQLGTGIVRSVYITELSPIKLRSLMISLGGATWAVSLCIVAAIAHFMRGLNWRYQQTAVSAISVTVIFDIIFIKESLLWLYANGKTKAASNILRAAIKANGITESSLACSDEAIVMTNRPVKNDGPDVSKDCESSPVALFMSEEERTGQYNGAEQPAKTGIKLTDVFKNKQLRGIMGIMCVVWFVNSLVYYGIFLMSSAMVGDRILNFFVFSVVEIPANIVLYVILQCFGRRKALIGCHALCAVCLLLAGIFNFTLDNHSKIIPMQVVTFIGKFGISASFTMLYFYTTELLPTNFRTSGLGIASFSARIGSFLSPFSSVLLRSLPWGPGIIFGSLCLFVTFLFLLVPETTSKKLPQTLAEIEMWAKTEKDDFKTDQK